MVAKTLCIAHGSGCIDGHAASWVVHRALGDDVELVYASYNRPPPTNIAGRDVLIVDFSYPCAVLEVMAQSACSVLVLDHHKSAAEDLAGLPRPFVRRSNMYLSRTPTFAEWVHANSSGPPCDNIAAIFDMSRSGAGLTWDYFNPGVPRPWFINLVEDRDLWKFTDDRSRPFHAAVTSYPLDFALWDRLYETTISGPHQDYSRRNQADNFAYDLIKEGTGILHKHDLDVQTVIRTTRRTMVIGGDRVPVCNCPGWMASDVGHALTENNEPCPTCRDDRLHEQCTDCLGTEIDHSHDVPFAATYYDRDGRRNFSLRSRPEGRDVSEVCRLYGGGGHRGAGGFEAPQGWEGESKYAPIIQKDVE